MEMAYIAKKSGYKSILLKNVKMALRFVAKGWTIEIYKDGRKSYTIKPEE